MTSQPQDQRAGAFRAIATLIETIEATESHVQNVTLTDKQIASKDTLGVEFEATVPNLTRVARTGIRPEGEGLRIAGDGTCTLTFTVEIPLDEMFRSSARTEQSQAEMDEPSWLPAQFEESGPTSNEEVSQTDVAGNDGTASDAESPSADSGDDSTPRAGSSGGSDDFEKPYRDPDRLREVYEEYETFAEMRDALEVDVTPQTVRRHMIKHDIHEVSANPFLESLRESANEQTERPPGEVYQPSEDPDEVG